MRVIIAGSRDFGPAEAMALVAEATLEATHPHMAGNGLREDGWNIERVVCGMCRGIDLAGKRWAESMDIPVDEFPADWSRHGRAAGPIRNREMAENADALIAISLNGSRGTRGMIQIAHELGLKVMVVEVER